MFFLRLYYALLFLIVEHASTEASTSFLNDEAGSLSLNDNFFFAKDDIASSNDIIYSNDNLFPDPKDTSTIFDNNLSLAESLCSDPNEHLNNNLQIRQFCANPSQSSPTTPTIPKLPDLDDIENAVNQPPNSETDSKTDSATDPDIEILVQVEEPTRPEAPFRVGNNDVGRAMSESEPEYYCHGWDANSYFIPVCASSNPIDRIKTKPDVYDELRNSKLLIPGAVPAPFRPQWQCPQSQFFCCQAWQPFLGDRAGVSFDRFYYEDLVLGVLDLQFDPSLGTGYRCINLMGDYGWPGYLYKPGMLPSNGDIDMDDEIDWYSDY